MTPSRRDIEFSSEGDAVRGWFYPGEGSHAPCPAIIMAHGFGAVKEMYLDRYAETFAAAGFAVLVFDYRRLGASDGTPRQEIDPAAQIEDYRNAISWMSAQPDVDAKRIGLWGTSYSGGHVLVLAATDPRVKCVVSQVPTISGNAVGKRRFTPETLAPLLEAFHRDRKARMDGAGPEMRTLVSHDPADAPVYAAAEAVDWYQSAAKRGGHWENRVTLRSIEYSRAYEPGAWVPLISDCPLLMIVAREDVVTPADLALAAYATAPDVKQLLEIDGGHFAAYVEAFAETSSAAQRWFSEHLM
ncbi:alpha/beta hydrolase [Marivita sp. S6314]|uniref:alpha/beta hydrolase n=1 Tax=Marivita sp. S6314 TaxID=2926406 RepID=UPI001FF46B75|nr:alpha/beta hydrolase [Marivita sp. S6314]